MGRDEAGGASVAGRAQVAAEQGGAGRGRTVPVNGATATITGPVTDQLAIGCHRMPLDATRFSIR
jgi:hypothetical protein